MAWITELKPTEEIVIDGKTVIRLEGDRPARIRIESISKPPRHTVVKRAIALDV